MMKNNDKFITPYEQNQKSKQKMMKAGCIACLALACVMTVQNLTPLSIYANPGIDEYTKFVVAHACGAMEVDGKTKKYLNVVEGVDHYYARGTRMFEVDFAFSKEGELVGTHKYEYLSGYNNSRRIALEDYNNKLIAGKFHGMTSERLFELMKKYPDAKFIIDTKEDEPFAVYSKLISDAIVAGVDISKSVVPFVFSTDMLKKLEEKYDFEEFMFSNYKTHYSTDELVDIVEGNEKIKYVHMFVTDFPIIEINELNKRGVRVFAHMDNTSIFHLALNWGCTGIFSDDISEDVFNVKYKHILDSKLESPETDEALSKMSLAEMLGVNLEG